jgi:hypothetical protein
LTFFKVTIRPLTTGTDALSGSSGSDIFSGVLVVKSSGAATTVVDAGTTIVAGDALTGNLGTDTLRISVSGVTDTTDFTINAVSGSSIEAVELSNFATSTRAVVLDATLFDTSLNSVSLTSDGGNAATSVTNLKSLVNAAMSNGSANLTVASIAGAISGTTDSATLTVSNRTGGTFTYNGVETFWYSPNSVDI